MGDRDGAAVGDNVVGEADGATVGARVVGEIVGSAVGTVPAIMNVLNL